MNTATGLGVRPLLLWALLCVSLASAQSPHWTTIPLDAASATVQSRVNTLAVIEGNRVLCFSPFLRTWTVIEVATPPVVVNQNEHVLIQDGSTFHGWSPRTGLVDTVHASASAALVSGPGSSNFVVLVQDGNDYHAYSAYRGHWATLSLPGPANSAVLHRQCAIVEEGGTAWAFSTYHGSWVPQTVSAGATVLASGRVGVVHDAQNAWCFTAERNLWAAVSISPATLVDVRSSYATFSDGVTFLVFGGHRGGFASYTAVSGSGSSNPGTYCLAVIDGNTVACYSAFRETFTTHTFGDSPSLFVESDFVIAFSSTETRAWSGVDGGWSSSLPAGYTIQTNNSIAFAAGSSDSWAYSPLVGWTPAPAQAFTAVDLTQTSVVLTHANGFSALGNRFTSWETLATTTAAPSLMMPSPRGTVPLVDDGGTLAAWDCRLGRWASAPITAANFTNQRTAFSGFLGENGTTAHGFGSLGGTWNSVGIQGTVVAFSSGSGVGYVQTDDHLHVHSALGNLFTRAAYPESSNVLTLGTTFEINLAAAPYSEALVALSGTSTYQDFFFGLRLVGDPILHLTPVSQVPADGIVTFPVFVPDNPLLAGFQVHAQALVVPTGGVPYLSNAISPVVY